MPRSLDECEHGTASGHCNKCWDGEMIERMRSYLKDAPGVWSLERNHPYIRLWLDHENESDIVSHFDDTPKGWNEAKLVSLAANLMPKFLALYDAAKVVAYVHSNYCKDDCGVSNLVRKIKDLEQE